MFWCDKVTGLSQNFWLRALGWYSMALLDTMDKDSHKEQGALHQMKEAFKSLIDAMLNYQDLSGMWYQVVNLGGMEKNYLETSGSAIFSYAILKGVRLGYLPESYAEYGKKAFEGNLQNLSSYGRRKHEFRRNLPGGRSGRQRQKRRNIPVLYV